MFDPLTARARTTPEVEALVAAETGGSWTYGRLAAESGAAAARLDALGVAAGDHVGVVMPPSVTYVGLVHAISRLGGVLVPLGHELTAPELSARIERADVTTLVCGADTEQVAVEATEDSGVPVVTVDEPHWERVAALSAGDPGTDGAKLSWPADRVETHRGRADEDGATESTPTDGRVSTPSAPRTDHHVAAAAEGLEGRTSPTDVAPLPPTSWRRSDRFCILFTSGTTGEPKAVELTLGNVLTSAVASAFRLGVTPEDRWLVPLSLHHMGGLAPLYRSALYGSTVVLRRGFDAGPTADDLAEYDCTAVSLVPTMLRRMLSARGTLTDSLRFVLLGGAPATEELLDRCENFSVPVATTYGMTETTSQIATSRPGEVFDHEGTVGRPLLWTNLTVVDDDGVPVERGDVGEFVVSGPTVTPGYYGDPDRTEDAFGDYGLHTGDVGYRDADGRVYVLNRKDDRIITGGETVDPGEVVDALRSFPTVDDAAVVGLDDPEWGERVAALVVADDLDRARLEAHLQNRLAPYKVPKSLAVADEVPRTISGTVDRESVRTYIREAVAIADAEGGFRFGESLTAEVEGGGESDPESAEEEAARGSGEAMGGDVEDGKTAGLAAVDEAEGTPYDTSEDDEAADAIDSTMEQEGESESEAEPGSSDDISGDSQADEEAETSDATESTGSDPDADAESSDDDADATVPDDEAESSDDDADDSVPDDEAESSDDDADDSVSDYEAEDGDADGANPDAGTDRDGGESTTTASESADE